MANITQSTLKLEHIFGAPADYSNKQFWIKYFFILKNCSHEVRWNDEFKFLCSFLSAWSLDESAFY